MLYSQVWLKKEPVLHRLSALKGLITFFTERTCLSLLPYINNLDQAYLVFWNGGQDPVDHRLLIRTVGKIDTGTHISIEAEAERSDAYDEVGAEAAIKYRAS